MRPSSEVPVVQAPGAAVEVLRWPLDAAQRSDLRARRVPCIWLLERGELPPELGDHEDWVRLPVQPRDLHVRMQRLSSGAVDSGRLVAGEVRVDPDGLLTVGQDRVVVPHLEALILNRLGATPGRVVRREELRELIWPDERRSPRAIDSRVHTLRVRIAPLGLHIHTIRGRGFLLAVEPDPSNEPAPRDAPRRYQWSN